MSDAAAELFDLRVIAECSAGARHAGSRLNRVRQRTKLQRKGTKSA